LIKRYLGLWLTVAIVLGGWGSAAEAQPARPARVFGLPFADPPGPSTWYLGQLYGNTSGAYNERSTTYRAGQGLHFGIDLSAPCGTPIVAIGDGVVSKVDAAYHGSAPHNLMIDHPQVGYASFYGHLLKRADVRVGQQVKRGEVVGYSGDPDETCRSRPHLHLEIRDLTYTRAYNPILLIDADWDSLALIRPYGRGFARDLENPRRWQFMDDQPETRFGGALLNDYANPWPPGWPVDRR
jgi:murein DD-endopeptidase MepM/ murein hydrolase activator NlpD